MLKNGIKHLCLETVSDVAHETLTELPISTSLIAIPHVKKNIHYVRFYLLSIHHTLKLR